MKRGRGENNAVRPGPRMFRNGGPPQEVGKRPLIEAIPVTGTAAMNVPQTTESAVIPDARKVSRLEVGRDPAIERVFGRSTAAHPPQSDLASAGLSAAAGLPAPETAAAAAAEDHQTSL